MRAIVKEVTGYDSANVKVSTVLLKWIPYSWTWTNKLCLLQQNIYQCVEEQEAEYITDDTVPPPVIGKVEQIAPSVSTVKPVKGAVQQMVSLI